ncbi:MAG: endonuclease III [bacterium]|nr:endonuclease III [bacterium]
METLRRTAAQWRSPIVTELANQRVDPFKILVSTILSLRTKDDCTAAAAARLFSLADTTEALARLDETAIARVIYPVGFYRTKAATIREISRRLLAEHGGRVPDSIDELLKFKGVGRKTANLVVTLGHGKPGICVDTHVHRITNRWGYVATRTPGETETALRARLPRRYWIPINDWLVAFGQHLCTPVSPHCSRCPLGRWCARRGVERSR